VVTHQLQVERRTGKVRRSQTDVLAVYYATKCPNGILLQIMFAYLGAVQTGHNHVKFHRYQCRDGVWDFKTKILCNFRISARRCASLALLQEMFIVCGQFHCGKLESKRFAQGVPGLRVFKVGVRFLRVFSDPAQNYCNLCLPHSKRSGWLCATLCLYSTTVRLIYKTYSCIVWSIEFRFE